MSASLVGSEMCIRDRARVGAAHKLTGRFMDMQKPRIVLHTRCAGAGSCRRRRQPEAVHTS
eukprot:14954881-Alexandrium_andersonii.AAC.1